MSVSTHFDEEHELWDVRFVNSQGTPHSIGWGLISSPEYKQMIARYRQIAEYMQAALPGRVGQERRGRQGRD